MLDYGVRIIYLYDAVVDIFGERSEFNVRVVCCQLRMFLIPTPSPTSSSISDKLHAKQQRAH
jgi:hypothetical protein